jgi:hypothetical protein
MERTGWGDVRRGVLAREWLLARLLAADRAFARFGDVRRSPPLSDRSLAATASSNMEKTPVFMKYSRTWVMRDCSARSSRVAWLIVSGPHASLQPKCFSRVTLRSRLCLICSGHGAESYMGAHGHLWRTG